jgi:hypothetical protein
LVSQKGVCRFFFSRGLDFFGPQLVEQIERATHTRDAALRVSFVQGPAALHLFVQGGLGPGRQHDDAILIALAGADENLVAIEVEVVDAEAQACPFSQPGPVE